MKKYFLRICFLHNNSVNQTLDLDLFKNKTFLFVDCYNKIQAITIYLKQEERTQSDQNQQFDL